MISLSIHKKLWSTSGEMDLKIQMDIEKGKLVTLFGKSGAGKTSVLRLLAGLFTPDEGVIKVNNQVWFDKENGINVHTRDRKIGFVFQDYALFPNMTVEGNLLFALGKNQDIYIVKDLIEIVELGELKKRKPGSLSGGQRQRVALARALVQKPEILLLDEPLSALDHEMRFILQGYILQLHREFGLTTLLVSHDISEILKMSDEIIELEQGKIIRQGQPLDIFSHKEVSGKFQFTGEVIGMVKQDFIFIISILIGKDMVKVIADEEEARTLEVGDKVLVASKAFNPVIKKL